MKKLMLLFLICIALISFTSCSPDSSSASDEATLLKGEVVPPSDDELATMTDEEVKTVLYVLALHTETISGKSEIKTEIDYGDEGKISIEEDTEDKENGDYSRTFTVNGEMTKGSDVYKVDNLVIIVTSSSGIYSYEKVSGSALKNSEEMTAEEAFSSLLANIDKEKLSSQSYKYWASGVEERNLLDGDKLVGTGTFACEYTTTKEDGISGRYVYDYTVGDVEFKAKTVASSNKASVAYISINGKFFKVESSLVGLML